MANDETFQFISDALVNNPMLGLATNGAGVVGVFDPKNGFALKGGFQQSNTDATNLSESIFSLVEVDYVARPPGLGGRQLPRVVPQRQQPPARAGRRGA